MLNFDALTSAQLMSFTRLNLPSDVVECNAEIQSPGTLLLQVLTESFDFDVVISPNGRTEKHTYGEPGSGVSRVEVLFTAR